MPKTIPPDSTIASVYGGLTHPDKYVRGSLQKMRACNKAHNDSSIKISVAGTGVKPPYRVTYAEDGKEKVFGSFADTHEPLEAALVSGALWSSKSMSFDELLNFYADAIGYAGKRV